MLDRNEARVRRGNALQMRVRQQYRGGSAVNRGFDHWERRVGNVHNHPKAIHPPHHIAAEGGQPIVNARPR